MKKTVLAAVIFAATNSGSVAFAADTLRFGVDPTFTPFESKATDGTLQGFDIDLGNAICQQAKVKCEWVVIGFDGIIPALHARKFDAILSAMGITPERRKQVAFTDMIYNTPSALIAAKTNPLDATIPLLKGKNIGVAQGTMHESYAKTFWAAKGVNIISYDNQMEIYPDLASGRLDGTLTNAIAAEQGFLNLTAGQNFAIKSMLNDKELTGEGVGIALRKDDASNLKLINDALAALHNNGTYDRLAKKYFTFDIYPAAAK